jgi:uncharacterized membrane protein YgdD (TMEM256/DUF423 family)
MTPYACFQLKVCVDNSNMEANERYFYRIAGIILALSAVVLGAFGAHALKDILITKNAVTVWETAVRYQMWHALALLILSLFPEENIRSKSVGRFLIIGTLLFSGSLYALAIGAPRWMGPVTPIGGLCLMTGWISLLVSVFKNGRNRAQCLSKN